MPSPQTSTKCNQLLHLFFFSLNKERNSKMKNHWVWQIPEQQLNINEEINDEKCVKAILQWVGIKQKFAFSLHVPKWFLCNCNQKIMAGCGEVSHGWLNSPHGFDKQLLQDVCEVNTHLCVLHTTTFARKRQYLNKQCQTKHFIHNLSFFKFFQQDL